MSVQDQLRERFNPVHLGDRREDRTFGAFMFQGLIQLLSLFGFVFCLTCLYLGMRGVMRLGGMVASGGPYAIAHPAPGWTWIIPVSILVSLIFIGLNIYASTRVGGLIILALAWPATFLSLGWNFLEFAFKSTKGQGLVWGWLVCGVVFVIMGGLPLVYVIQGAANALSGKERTFSFVGSEDVRSKSARAGFGRPGRLTVLILQLAVIGGGIVAADRFFHSLSGEKRESIVEKSAGPTSAVPEHSSQATTNRPSRPLILYSPRIVISFEHNTLELAPNEGRVFYNGVNFEGPKDLPLAARQVLEQTVDWLKEFLNN